MNDIDSPVTSVTKRARQWSIGEEGTGRGRDQVEGQRAREEDLLRTRAMLARINADLNKMDADHAAGSMREDGVGAAFQIIILGGGGGPGENDTTGLLVRSTSTEWGKNSVMAVDAGVHLSAIGEIFEKHLPNSVKVNPPPKRASRMASKPSMPLQPADSAKPMFYPPINEARASSRAPSPVDASPVKQMNVMTSGPFNSLMVPYETAAAISAYFLRNLVSTVLITHPHLDHLSGFVVNTAALQNTTKPKKVVGLPSTIEAIKTHIFNDVIWPNMSDEEGGIGFVSYQRLSEGGHSLLGEHDAAGYIEVCDSLAVKAFLVSHGNCVRRHRHRGSGSAEPTSPTDARRRSSRFDSLSAAASFPLAHSDIRGPRWVMGNDMQSFGAGSGGGGGGWHSQRCVVDSSAFFIRDDETSQELLIFGDVEPDKVSAEPRNHIVWSEAAPKVARGSLTTILIECSYDDSQADAVLFGHLAPRHLVAELAMLAAKVVAQHHNVPNANEAVPREPEDSPDGFTAAVTPTVPSRLRRGSLPGFNYGSKKRSHESPSRNYSLPASPADLAGAAVSESSPAKKRAMTSQPIPERGVSGISPLSSPTAAEPPTSMSETMQTQQARPRTRVGWEAQLQDDVDAAVVEEIEIGMPVGRGKKQPLEGVRVVVIHVKDPLKDDWDPRATILRQLKEHELRWRLGCEFVMCKRGDGIWV